MQNKFFSSKLNTVFLFILIILMIIAFRIMFKNKEIYFSEIVQNQQVEWVSSNFKGISYYAVDIWYPKNYTFNCCGDSEAGTYHSIIPPKGGVSNFIEIIEGGDFCFDYSNYVGTNCTTPDVFYQSDLKNGKKTEIDNFTAKNLGVSVFAFKGQDPGVYGSVEGIPYEEYIFRLKDQNSKEKYYTVSFFSPQEFSKDFKSEFLNRLEIWK